MTRKQIDFCEYYIQSGNATESAIKAGYKENSAKTIGSENLTKHEIAAYIKERLQPKHELNIATSNEVMQFFSATMRGEIKDQFGLDPSLSDRLAAAKEIAKRTVDLENKAGEKETLEKLDVVLESIGMRDKNV